MGGANTLVRIPVGSSLARPGSSRRPGSTPALLLAGLLMLSPRPALAVPEPPPPNTQPDPLVWSPRWARAGLPNYVLTGAAATLSLVFAITPPIRAQPSTRLGFDESARASLRLQEIEERYIVRDASDVTLSLLVTYPFFVDALIAAQWYRASPEVAFEMAVIDAEALAITAAIQGVTNTLAARERPFGRDCGGALPGDLNDCVSSMRYRSFFSGHSSLAFTSAALVCSHHLRLDLFGGGAVELATCGVAMGTAAATALFRVMADQHYLSDVLTGAAVGTIVGFLVPALHYGFADGTSFGNQGLQLRLLPTSNGLSVVGSF